MGVVVQVIEHLPSKPKILSSNPSTSKKKKKKKKKPNQPCLGHKEEPAVYMEQRKEELTATSQDLPRNNQTLTDFPGEMFPEF
jgi:uncharacterized protein YaiL (DUF2058 family)